MRNLFDVKGGKLLKVFSAIAACMDPVIGDAICDEVEGPRILGVMMAAAWDYLNRNPFEMTAEEQLLALARANDAGNWGMTDEDWTRLKASAPAWPKGKHAYRSFRIRFGEGDDGVASTFERHVARIKSVFTEKGFCRWELLHSGKIEYDGKPVERLRLLNGNHTHHAVVEWIVADLDTNRKRRSITAVRDAKSLADELLVIAWMFPDMIRAIDYDKLPGLFAAGYEANIPEEAKQEWQFVVVIGRNGVFFCSRSDNDSTFSVPRLLESPALGT